MVSSQATHTLVLCPFMSMSLLSLRYLVIFQFLLLNFQFLPCNSYFFFIHPFLYYFGVSHIVLISFLGSSSRQFLRCILIFFVGRMSFYFIHSLFSLFFSRVCFVPQFSSLPLSWFFSHLTWSLFSFFFISRSFTRSFFSCLIIFYVQSPPFFLSLVVHMLGISSSFSSAFISIFSVLVIYESPIYIILNQRHLLLFAQSPLTFTQSLLIILFLSILFCS